MMSLEEYKDFVLFCKENGVLSAKFGDCEVSFEPLGLGNFSELDAEEEDPDASESLEDVLFYSSEG